MREISVQAILAGMLKKWLMLVIVFVLVFAVAIGFNFYRVKKGASATNAITTEEAEKTVTTKTGKEVTVSQLNEYINKLRQKAQSYEKYLNNSYNYADNESLCQLYVVKAADNNPETTQMYAGIIAHALSEDFASEEFINTLLGKVEGLDDDFSKENISVMPVDACVQLTVFGLNDSLRSEVSDILSENVKEKTDDYKSVVGDFEISLLQETESFSLQNDIVSRQVEIFSLFNNTVTVLNEYKALALTVEDESQVGVVDEESSSQAAVQTSIGKKEIVISGAAAVIITLVVGFVYAAYGSKRILSTYDVRDISRKDILIAKAGAKAKAFDKRALKKCPQADDEMAYVRILKTVENLGSKRLIVDFGREEADADIVARFKENLSGKLEIIASSDFSKRVDFVSAWAKDDACLLTSKVNKSIKKEMLETLSDYSEAGVEVVGNIVLA